MFVSMSEWDSSSRNGESNRACCRLSPAVAPEAGPRYRRLGVRFRTRASAFGLRRIGNLAIPVAIVVLIAPKHLRECHQTMATFGEYLIADSPDLFEEFMSSSCLKRGLYHLFGR
jgi:hypothetical protein